MKNIHTLFTLNRDCTPHAAN